MKPPELPRHHVVSEPLHVPRWKKVLFHLFRGASVASGSGAASAMAAPAVVQVMTTSTSTVQENLGILGEWVRHAVEASFSEASAAQTAESAVASQPAAETEQRSEFQHLVQEAFQFLREQSTELAKDIMKDLAKGAVELYVLAKVTRCVVDKLRTKPANPVAKRMADILDKLILHRETHPTEPVTESTVAAATESTPVEARAALRLGGYELRGGVWIPLGLERP